MVNTNIILAKIHRRCKKYVKDSLYVYKTCYNKIGRVKGERIWLVVLKKLDSTITNEDRDDVTDAKYAKFRANELQVVKIINSTNPRSMKKQIVNVYLDTETKYEVGKFVRADEYDRHENNVCSGGIHYFKTVEAAYFYGSAKTMDTGIYCYWHDNGTIKFKGQFEKGLRVGEWSQWYSNGQVSSRGSYENGLKKGVWNEWYYSGDVCSRGEYINDKKEGEWIIGLYEGWYECGQYENDRREGTWNTYYEHTWIVNTEMED